MSIYKATSNHKMCKSKTIDYLTAINSQTDLTQESVKSGGISELLGITKQSTSYDHR